MSPVRVFLDSSDYSVLSGPEAGREPHVSVLRALRAYSASGAAVFYFTGPVVSEMAPLDPTNSTSAVQRGTLLVELCGRNCLISPERLIAHEIAQALGVVRDEREIWSSTGDWFPGGALELLELSPTEHDAALRDALNDQGANRAARRKAQRAVMKHGRHRPLARAMLVKHARSEQAALDIQAKYPMTIDDAKVLARYVAGDAPPDQAAAAFGSSLGDPSLLYRWIAHQPQAALKFMSWVRGPAADLTKSVLRLAEHTTRLRELDATYDLATHIERLTGADWQAQTDQSLLSIAHRSAAELLGLPAATLTLDAVARDCPGLVCAIRTMYEAWRSALVRDPRRPKDSDFPDMLHALYAPYVDLFRADGFMAPIVARHVANGRERVVSRLAQLPEAIKRTLNAGEA